jgi:hypothetical protein
MKEAPCPYISPTYSGLSVYVGQFCVRIFIIYKFFTLYCHVGFFSSFVSFFLFWIFSFICSFQGFGSGDSPEYDIDDVSNRKVTKYVPATASELTEPSRILLQ